MFSLRVALEVEVLVWIQRGAVEREVEAEHLEAGSAALVLTHLVSCSENNRMEALQYCQMAAM